MPDLVINSMGLGDGSAYNNLNVGNWGSYLSASWCNSFPALCSDAKVAASRGYLFPELNYNPILPTNAAVPAIPAGTSTAPGLPADLAEQQAAALAAQGQALKESVTSAAESIDSSLGGESGDPSVDPNAPCTILGVSCVSVVIGLTAFGMLLAVKDWRR